MTLQQLCRLASRGPSSQDRCPPIWKSWHPHRAAPSSERGRMESQNIERDLKPHKPPHRTFSGVEKAKLLHAFR